MMSLLLVVLVFLSWTYSFGQNGPYSQQALIPSLQWTLPKNPCPEYFHYELNRYTGSVFGVISMPKPATMDNYDFEVAINMTVGAAIVPNDGLRLRVLFYEGHLLYAETMLFQIYFPYSAREKIPWLNQLKFGDTVVCDGTDPPLNSDGTQTTLWARATVKVGSPNSKNIESFNTDSNLQSSFSFVMTGNSFGTGQPHPNIMAMVESGGSYNPNTWDIQSTSIGIYNSPQIMSLNTATESFLDLDSYTETGSYKLLRSPIFRHSESSPLKDMNYISKNPFSYLRYPEHLSRKSPPSDGDSTDGDTDTRFAGIHIDHGQNSEEAANDVIATTINEGQLLGDQGDASNESEAILVRQRENVDINADDQVPRSEAST